MANFVITDTTTVSQNLVSGETGYIAADGELVVSGSDAIVGAGSIELAVLGNVTSLGNFEAFDFDGVDLDMVIGTSGSMISTSDGALDLVASSRIEVTNLGAINADAVGITIATSDTGTAVNVFNDGTINGSSAITVNSGSGSTFISNSGSIFTNGTSVSISSLTGPTTITNSGVMQTSNGFAILTAGGTDNIVNSGTILGGISMGNGNDTYNGSAGYVSGRVDGAGGNDTLLGGDSAEIFRGGSDEDSIFAGGGNDTIQGDDFDQDNDFYDGGDGIDTLELDSDSEDLTVDLSIGVASGGFIGVDQLVSIENVTTGFGDDILIGNDDDNFLNGGGGDDTFVGGRGNDFFEGGDDNDTVDYSDAESKVVLYLDGRANGGDARGDIFSNIENLIGSDFADSLVGNDEDNTLEGGAGADTIFGFSGNDTLIGGTGVDHMVGGMGSDTYYVDDASETIIELADEGVNDRVFSSVTVSLRDFSQHLDNLFLEGSDNIDGTGNGQVNLIVGNSGNNVLNGACGDDVLDGGDGNDTFLDDEGADSMTGGDGSDTYYVDNIGDTITEFASEGEFDRVFTTVTYSLRDQSQHLENLTLTGSANINGTGNGQDNAIAGNSGNNVLDGAFGADVLIGRGGNDTLTGGGDSDTFVFSGAFGQDTITDFDQTDVNEKLDLSAVLEITDFADLQANHLFQTAAGDTVVYDGFGNNVTLTGVTIASLNADDFIF